jgi:hypothetical protein
MKSMISKLMQNHLLIVCVTIVVVVISLSRCVTFTFTDLDESHDQSKDSPMCNSLAGTSLYSELETLWSKGDKECFLRAITELADRRDKEAGVAAINKILSDNNSPLAQDNQVKVELLNYFVPKVLRGHEGSDVFIYRPYLIELAQTGKNTSLRSNAIMVLGYFKNDDDVDLIASAAKEGNLYDYSLLVTSVYSLTNNCSVKAKNALKTVVESKRFNEYESKYSGKDSYLLDIAEECIGKKQ